MFFNRFFFIIIFYIFISIFVRTKIIYYIFRKLFSNQFLFFMLLYCYYFYVCICQVKLCIFIDDIWCCIEFVSVKKSGIFTVHKRICVVQKNRLHETTKWRFFKFLVLTFKLHVLLAENTEFSYHWSTILMTYAWVDFLQNYTQIVEYET